MSVPRYIYFCMALCGSVPGLVADPTQKQCVDYISSRGFTTQDFNFYHAPSMHTRVIVPILYQNKNIGYVARAMQNQIKPKYYAQVQPGSLFNMDAQHWSRKFVVLVEGVFDAIMLDAVAILLSLIHI